MAKTLQRHHEEGALGGLTFTEAWRPDNGQENPPGRLVTPPGCGRRGAWSLRRR